MQRACKAALEAVYGLLAALQGVLPSDKYLQVSGEVQRRGLGVKIIERGEQKRE